MALARHSWILTVVSFIGATEAATDHVAHRSWKILPTAQDMSASELRSFYAGITELNNSQGLSASSDDLTSFAANDTLSNLVFNTTGVPTELQGLWWLRGHPTFGHGVFSFIGGDKNFDGNTGIDKPADHGYPGYVYASNTRPGVMAVPDTSGNRSKFVWFRDHGLEFSFPELNMNAPWNATDIIHNRQLTSYLNVHLDVWYKKFPIPAAILEGFTFEKMAAWQIDPKKKTDPAKCFCSVIYSGPDEIIRNNFGRFSYKFHRIADGQGLPTRHWEEFKATLQSSGIKQLVKIGSQVRSANPLFV